VLLILPVENSATVEEFLKMCNVAVLLLLLASIVAAATPAQWRGKSIYQLLTDRFARTDGSTTSTCNTGDRTYCGGTWQGVINHLDYIQGMGFTAVWISPITLNLPETTPYGQAYHGYWQQNIDALNPNFGTAEDLKELSSALHARGMYLMVDVVVNHFGWDGNASTVDYSQFVPFNSSSYFHSYCTISQDDYNSRDENVQLCWLGDSNVELPDVNTTEPVVRNTYDIWIANLVSTYSIDGLRIDTVKHVEQEFWPGFNSAAGVYSVGEVFDGDPAYVCGFQNDLDGLLNYPLWYPLTAAFSSTSGSIGDLVNQVNTIKSDCKDSTLLGTFLENHDNPRFAGLTSDPSLRKNAIAFTVLADGIPIIYEGQEQGYTGGADPANREAVWLSGYSTTSTLYTFIAGVNQIRNQAIYKSPDYLTYMAYPIYSDSSTIAMRKGFDGNQIIGVFSNLGVSGPSYNLTLGNTGYVAGESVIEILTCTTVNTDSNGNIAVAMSGGLPKVSHATETDELEKLLIVIERYITRLSSLQDLEFARSRSLSETGQDLLHDLSRRFCPGRYRRLSDCAMAYPFPHQILSGCRIFLA
jgi:alpha-amylase